MKTEIKFKIVENGSITDWEEIRVLPSETNISQCFEDSKIIWLQYTGFKDSKGVEIYDDDIAYCSEMTYVVKRNENGCYELHEVGTDKVFILHHSFQYIEVVGNKHTTPNLLIEKP